MWLLAKHLRIKVYHRDVSISSETNNILTEIIYKNKFRLNVFK